MPQRKGDYNNIHDGPWHLPGKSTGGPGGPGDMETRVAILEKLAESTDQRMSRIEDDLRSISAKMDGQYTSMVSKTDSNFTTLVSKMDKQLYFTIAMLLGLAGLIAKSAGWI